MEVEKLFSNSNTREETIDFEGTQIQLKVRDLTWSEKNQILSKCFSYNSDGGISFNFDRYLKEVLTKIIVNAPWGETNHIFLSRIKPEFGAKLEKLAPKVIDDGGGVGDFFGKG